MTWNEIKSALVRRWPDKFVLYPKLALLYGEERAALMESDDVFELMSTDEERDGLTYSENELSDIVAICEAIGQWVWSDPMAAYPQKWWGMWWDREREKARHTPYAYNTRAEAELAALGEWLNATEK